MKNYYFIVLELTDCNGEIHRGVAYTLQNPHQYIQSMCEKWIETGKISSNAANNGIVERELNCAFSSWKGIKRKVRFENYLKYFFIMKQVDDIEDIYGFQSKLLKKVNAGKYQDEMRFEYLPPEILRRIC